jgi:N-acetylmuramoyl-L-alanine amidase
VTAGTKATTASGTSQSTNAKSRYTVKSGDTVSAIATRFGTSVARIVTANGIDNPSRIAIGQVLTIPGGVPTGLVGDTFAGRTYPKNVVSAANTNKAILNDTSVPNRAQMRALVQRTAKKYGVDVSLALAISYQESGFNMRAVSPANAVGVMQVIPSTGEWISTVVGRRLDLLDPEDNVTAGVALLSYLTRNADSLDQAIAGYYQGLSGVRKNGMNRDTKQYVKSVRSLMKQFD